MSSDNFHYVKGNKVYMGFASDFQYDMERFEERWYARLARRCRPIYEADSHEAALEWAWDEYSEYGVWREETGSPTREVRHDRDAER
jgi:hypothetical protein